MRMAFLPSHQSAGVSHSHVGSPASARLQPAEPGTAFLRFLVSERAVRSAAAGSR